jgi:sugar phosphate isomerase/epimerase
VKLGLINSAWVQAGRDAAYGVAKTREIGFDSIDIFLDPLDARPGEVAALKAECDRHGLPVVSVACVALGLADFNPPVRRFHEGRCRAYLDMCREFDAQNLLLVLGEYLWEKQVIPAAAQWEMAAESCRLLGEYAAGSGLEIALEMEPFALSLLRTVDDMVRFLDAVGVPAVKANIDVSHMQLAGVRPEELRKLKGRAAHVHISDCDGRVHGDLPPGRGVVPFAPYLAEIKNLGIDGAISLELEYSPEPEKIVEWVEEAYRETDRLMSEHGLRG